MTGTSKGYKDEIEAKKAEIRTAAEASLSTFIRLVHPQRVLGNVHLDVINWWEREDAKSHQLLLLPRDHGKSALVAYRVAWYITRYPAIRVLYISSTSNLASKQLKFIKDILTSDIYRYYWPEMVNKEEGKREKWTETEIAVDHPERKKEAVRDPTVFTAGLTTGITGLHCDIAVLDDVVVKENAYTREGRRKVEEQYSLLSSIEGANAKEWVVGTRYHPNDLYSKLLSMSVEQFDEAGNVVSSESLYEVFERQVESKGDGTGEFIWPRQQRKDGAWFGFNREILAKKKAQYLDKLQFRAQYYNDPSDPEKVGIDRSWFQYYDRSLLRWYDGNLYLNGKRLNVFAAIDFAYSLREEADFTALVTIGVDSSGNIFVIDIDRFKTNSIKEYYRHIFEHHVKWGFRKLAAEVTVAQRVIVEDLKMNYILKNGLILTIEEMNPKGKDGTKEERIFSTLQPRYESGLIWHYREGNCQILEDELVSHNPPHDDVKDALTCAVQISSPPSSRLDNIDPSLLSLTRKRKGEPDFGFQKMGITPNSRFGGFL